MSSETVAMKLKRLETLSPSDIEALDLLLTERIREIEQEQWTPEWDDEQRRAGELSAAAASYALAASQKAKRHLVSGNPHDTKPSACHPSWPFSPLAWKPTTARRMVEKSVALGLSELSRLLRAGIQ